MIAKKRPLLMVERTNGRSVFIYYENLVQYPGFHIINDTYFLIALRHIATTL